MSPRSNHVQELFWCFVTIGFALLACLYCLNTRPVPDPGDSPLIVLLTGAVLAGVAGAVLAARSLWRKNRGDETTLAARTVRAVNHAADVVRDSILDWSLDEEPTPEAQEPLPPL